MEECSHALSGDELRAVRELLDIRAIQEVMLRYARSIDRGDASLVDGVFWEDGTDDHGMFSGDGRTYMRLTIKNRGWRIARSHHHMIGPVDVTFVDDGRAHVETYFHYVGIFEEADGTQAFGGLGGRYCDVFEARGGQWRVLRRVVVYDWVDARPYEPDWDAFTIPEGRNRGALGASDPTMAAVW